MSKTIGIMLGSFRRQAYSRSVALAFTELLPSDYHVLIPHLHHLPLFVQDYDDDNATPDEWVRFRQEVLTCDAILFVTPEYNRSFPAVLKNAIDIASRPAGQNLWAGKPGAVISVSPGRIGGALANQHLRQPLTFLQLRMLTAPELYVSDIASLVDKQGKLADEATIQHLQKFTDAFIAWTENILARGSAR